MMQTCVINCVDNRKKQVVPDVLMRQLRSSNQGFISVPELVVDLITLTQTVQDLYSFIYSWFRYLHRLEPSL